MDHYGIGHALQAMVKVYLISARRNGRTSSLIESLHSGDRAVFCNNKEAERVRRLCKERGLEVDCVVVPPEDPSRLLQSGTAEGRTIFDHSWVERFYEEALKRCAREIDLLQRETSGYGTAHIETRQAYAEHSKWKV